MADADVFKNFFREVELLKSKADSLYFKMEEIEINDEKQEKRFHRAKSLIDEASGNLLHALDSLRTYKS